MCGATSATTCSDPDGPCLQTDLRWAKLDPMGPLDQYLRRLALTLAVIASLAAGPIAWANSVDVLLTHLESGSYASRESASAELAKLGPSAVPALVEFAQRNSPEASLRGVAILRAMCLSPDDATSQAAETGLRQLAESVNRVASLAASDIVMSLASGAGARLEQLGCKPLAGQPVLTLTSRWHGGRDGLVNLRWLPGIRILRVERAPLEDEALAHLRWVPELTELVIRDAPITDRVFEHLRHVPRLRGLYLNGTRITDAGVAQLAQHESLRWLELRHTSLTDASVESLGKLKGLKVIDIVGTKISADGVKRLSKLLPATSVCSSVDGP